MKHYFKKLTVFLYICLALFAYSCSEENDFVKEQNQGEKIIVRKMSFNEFSKNPAILSKLNQVKNKETLAGRIVYDSIHDFYINTDYCVYLEKEGKTSYTFALYRDVDNGKTENLVLSSKDDGSFESKMVIYDITAAEKELITIGAYIDFLNKTKIIDLEKIYYTEMCFTTNLVVVHHYCSLAGHSWAQRYDCEIWRGEVAGTPPEMDSFMWVVDVSQCLTSGGNEGNEGTGGNGVGSGNGSGAVLTTPVTCGRDCIEAEIASDNCKKIQNQKTKFSSLSQGLVNLATTTSQSNENGIFIDNTATSTTNNPIQNVPAGIGGTIDINKNPTYKYVMIAHTHDAYGLGNGTFSVFSFEDLATLAQIAEKDKLETSNFVFYLATADTTYYALTINDVSKLKNYFSNTTLAVGLGATFDSAKFIKISKMNEKYFDKDKGKIEVNSTNKENDLIYFLEFLKDTDLGLTMFETDATFTEYKKVSLQTIAGINSVKRDDCN